jgi:hypothetical protein
MAVDQLQSRENCGGRETDDVAFLLVKLGDDKRLQQKTVATGDVVAEEVLRGALFEVLFERTAT